MLIEEGITTLLITPNKNNNNNIWDIINLNYTIKTELDKTSSIYNNSNSYSLNEETIQGQKEEENLFLYLRYYARHFIPIFCIVGIVGNCMALILIRQDLKFKFKRRPIPL